MEEYAKQFKAKVEEMQSRVQTQMLPVEKKTWQCVVDCYSKGKDYNSVHQCADSCQSQLQSASKKVAGEFEALQSSIQACQQSKQKMLEPRFEAARTDQKLQDALQKEFEDGVRRCMQEAEPMLPGIEKRIKDHLRV
ncbi:unnamed protein product [Prorocentrum cordatum]|uniref:F-BAR domain-containing protein n=1 Tax=Prorocentrum cordatum TaxID=2364126 RepID=A0ABN9UBP6_9DINO|nr:unnamed protein product [Polarella glacialis]|mmetsp:Transcript_22745/g.59339  ORF Transcript_22745/g.59339 Transcript_22745/m.59339 type:complete len:137 (-) Transcript_22745:250-660(-)